MANEKRDYSFMAFHVDLHYLKTTPVGSFDATTWSGPFISDLFKYIEGLNSVNRKMAVKGEWFMLLEEVKYENDYIYGYFTSAEYGSVRNLIHADTLVKRDNPKNIREGEEQYTHFLVRKSDGLLILQWNQKVTRARVTEYLDKYAPTILNKYSYQYINICTLVGGDFLEELKKLDTISETVLEITSKEKADDNEFIQEVQDEVESLSATHVALSFKAKHKRDGLGKLIPFINKYKGQRGVTSIKVVGDQDGAERKININTYSEKYRKSVKVDGNGNPMSPNVYEQLKQIAVKRDEVHRHI
nr:hypothetical protein [Paenibacillus xylanexedens]